MTQDERVGDGGQAPVLRLKIPKKIRYILRSFCVFTKNSNYGENKPQRWEFLIENLGNL